MSGQEPDRADLDELRTRLAEAEDTLRAIHAGEVDAVVVTGPAGEQIYTLRGAEQPYRTLVEEMQDGAATLDEGGIVLFCNRRFAELVGTPLDVVIGGPVARFVPPEEAASFATLLQMTGRRRACVRRSDGSTREVYLSVVPFAAGDADGRALIVTDLTDLLDARHRREEAERDNRAKDEFLALVGHELRNPIAAIASAARVLEIATGRPEQAARARAVLGRQVHQLARLVDDLLDVGRVTTGHVTLERRPVNVAAAVEAAAVSLSLSHRGGPAIEVVAAPVWVNADPLRLEQIIVNLVGNALKFTPSSGHVSITVRPDGGAAVLEVRDTGEGIDPDLLPRVFDLFVQGKSAVDATRSGLGMGLTLVRRLAQLQDGTVSAHSDGRGSGCTFTVRLPAVAQPSSTVAGSAAVASARRRVLVVDDNDDGRESLVVLLELAGHEVFGAASGLAALDVYRQFKPAVAIVDIGLPDMDGYEVARSIRREPDGRDVRLIALSGYGSPSHRERAIASGFDRYLIKPAAPDELARAMTIEFSGRGPAGAGQCDPC